MFNFRYIKYCLLFWAFSMQAQDTLYLKTQTKVLGKVQLISTDSVYYTFSQNENTIQQAIHISELDKIVFSNGKQQHFLSPVFNGPNENKAVNQPLYRNSISLNLLSMMNGDLAFQYQRIFPKRRCSLVIPIAFMFTDYPLLMRETPNEIQLDKKNYDVGIGLYLHQTTQSNYFYIGPVFRLQEYNCSSTYTVLDFNGYLYQYVQKAVFNRFIGSITTGYFVGARNRLSCNLFFSLGYRYDHFQNNLYLPFTETVVTTNPYPGAMFLWLGFNLGYNF